MFLQQRRGALAACENGERIYCTKHDRPFSQKNPSSSPGSWRIKPSVRGDTRIFLNEFTATHWRRPFLLSHDNARSVPFRSVSFRFVSFHFAPFPLPPLPPPLLRCVTSRFSGANKSRVIRLLKRYTVNAFTRSFLLVGMSVIDFLTEWTRRMNNLILDFALILYIFFQEGFANRNLC